MTHPYATLDYAESLGQGGTVLFLESLAAPVCLRPIPGTEFVDATGVYPFTGMGETGARDIATLKAEMRSRGLVSLVLVVDPFTSMSAEGLDVDRTYKSHHLVDPAAGELSFSRHHRQEIRRALRRCEARPILLRDHLADFIALYDILIARHGLTGVHRFPASHFAHLAGDPSAFPAFGAFRDGRLVSAHIFMRHRGRSYSHLAASSEDGYRCGAAYAVYDCAIRALLAEGPISLGGAPDGGSGTGLDRFKRGFAHAARPSRLCGVIADRALYGRLCDVAGQGASGPTEEYFPAYRSAAVPGRPDTGPVD